jgi:vacuolar-type H+-ATPase subunit I/STV1
VRVEEELKRKRAELLGEADELAHRIETIRKQVSAIDQVIAIYDPAHTAPSAARAERKRSRQVVPLPPELNRLNKTEAIFEALREAGEPLSSADCTSRIAAKHGIAAVDLALRRFVPHVTAGLNSLMRCNRVRQVGTVDGQKPFGGIAA